jgi:hypothetical protein
MICISLLCVLAIVLFDTVYYVCDLIWVLVFSATFSHISAISWRPVLVVEEAGVPGENQTSPLWSCKRFYRYIFLIYFLSNKLFVS